MFNYLDLGGGGDYICTQSGEEKYSEGPLFHTLTGRLGHPVWIQTKMPVLIIKLINSKSRGKLKRRFCVVCSDKVPGPLNGTAEHHAEDHPKDLWRGGDRNTGYKPH